MLTFLWNLNFLWNCETFWNFLWNCWNFLWNCWNFLWNCWNCLWNFETNGEILNFLWIIWSFLWKCETFCENVKLFVKMWNFLWNTWKLFVETFCEIVKLVVNILACSQLTDERRLEEGFWAPESLVANGDDLTVGEFVALLQWGAGSCGCHLVLEVKGDVAELLLDVTHDFSLGCIGDKMRYEVDKWRSLKKQK